MSSNNSILRKIREFSHTEDVESVSTKNSDKYQKDVIISDLIKDKMIPAYPYLHTKRGVEQYYDPEYKIISCNNEAPEKNIELEKAYSHFFGFLKEDRDQPKEIFIENQKVQIQKMGRGGGSKDPYLIVNGKYFGYILMVIKLYYGGMLQMMKTDINISSVLTKTNLLNVQHRSVQISLDGKNYFPALVSISFDIFNNHLNDGIKGYVIDRKLGEDLNIKELYFDSEEDLLTNFDKWNNLLDEFFIDVYKLEFLRLPVGGDSFNLIYLIYPDGRHKLRYFGFDLSHKGDKCKIFPLLEKLNDENREEILQKEIKKYQDYNEKINKYVFFITIIEIVMFNYYDSAGKSKMSIERNNIIKVLGNIKAISKLSDEGLLQIYEITSTF